MNTYATPEPITAAVSLSAAEIRVSATDRADTTVEVRPADPADATDVAAAERARVEYAGGRLTVKDRSRVRYQPGRLVVTVGLPTGSALAVTVRDGGLSGEGRLGPVRAHVADGHIRLDSAGELRLSTERGDISVDRAADGVHATVSHGSVVIGELRRGLAELSVGAGRIGVGVPEGTAIVLDAKTALGRVRDNLGDLPEPSGDDTAELRAHLGSGDIVLDRVSGN
ncbi:hypothetical protein Afil01_34340 [Actinorhabdospora filicis]|uniref:Adhesin domain-containing protein n=1 Tax=Actinorhabdospora filicis TaxID=1785913 RepID=A0A9W6SMH4_9ACTN|nr:hypothetical protein [Actinorhabdospora filicis]GLZ78627.1 hypothetical protein Afil01_34340 [Actinorhabdospora filicis]